jgi:SAM-dependent methyltransferase
MPTTNEEQLQIEKGYGHSYVGFRTDEVFNHIVGVEIKTRLAVLAPPPCSLLDVGCGAGEFLAIASQHSYDCLGIDVSTDGVEIARQKGLNARVFNFLTHDFDQTFHVITMWDVMEHLRTPHDFLCRAAELLDDGGVLVLKIPGFGLLNFNILKWFPSRAGVLLGAPDHIQYFSPESLRRLLGRCGFKNAIWFPSMPFRSKPPKASLKRKASRFMQRRIGKVAGNRNLYLFATKHDLPTDITGRLNADRIERLDC